jgi:hypothetical protein
MKLIELEGVYVNPDAVCLVREADPNAQGFQTEVICDNGSQLFKLALQEVATLLQR